MASEMGWGGVPLMRPSNLATRYQLYEKNIIPERCIETGQRYRPGGISSSTCVVFD